ncbi:hypothetical protein BDR04DRAFT_1147638 [Suillus decipiens]|nr:hypothetical protein BDR04DRAFT_1147638 [Suillus decipiens]
MPLLPVQQTGFFPILGWLFSVLPKKWWKVQPETKVSSSTRLDVDDGHLAGLTAKVVKEPTHAIAQGSFGDAWKCRLSEKDNNAEVS